MLIGINVFPVAGAVYYWFPKFTGRLLNERLGLWNFWTMFIGFNLGFFPMHLVGLQGMPRRIYTYSAAMGWSAENLIISIGALVFAVGVLLLLINVAVSLRKGRLAGSNPWDAPTLEWSMPSPPPPYNFAVIPSVASRHPLWESQLDENSERSDLHHGLLLDHGRETIATAPLDGEPQLILQMPGDTSSPFFLALGLTILFAAALAHLWWLAGAGVTMCGLALAVWFWPGRPYDGAAEAKADV